MSEQPAEGQQQQPNPETVELAPSGDGAFGALMDFLAPEKEDGTPASAGGEAAAASAPDAGSDAAAGSTAPAGGADGGAVASPAAGDATAATAGDSGAGGADASGGDKPAGGGAEQSAAVGDGSARPADWTATAADQVVELGKLSTTFEENTQNGFRAEALADVKKEYPKYFEALETHPRLLVGREVPKIDGTEGTEVLKDANDAREWQEAVKSVLYQEVQGRASVKLDENRDFIQTIHASIDLFKNNPDLIPGTKDFDVELANTFATFAKPYEVRDDGRLVGYSVPVQPLIDQLREQVIAKRGAAAAAPEATPPAAGQEQQPPADPPQAGVQSKAGASADGAEDFSTLFGTIAPGLNIRI